MCVYLCGQTYGCRAYTQVGVAAGHGTNAVSDHMFLVPRYVLKEMVNPSHGANRETPLFNVLKKYWDWEIRRYGAHA